MTVSEQLAHLGLKWGQFGRLLRVHRNTVTLWRHGTVPGYARAYLDLAITAQTTEEAFAAYRARVEAKASEILEDVK